MFKTLIFAKKEYIMNKVFSLFLVSLLLFACNTSTNSNDAAVEERVESKNQLFLDLVRPEAGGMFRGVEFDMSKDAVKNLETARGNVNIYKDDVPEDRKSVV